MLLESLQDEFSNAVLDPDAPVPMSLGRNVGYSPLKRFSVYRNNVVSSLVEALKTAFPTINKLVGDVFFDAMAAVFVRLHPPKTPILALYGDEFPVFLRTFEPVAALAYLPDIALLELARRQVYHAADAEPLAPDFMAAFAPECLNELVFLLHPAHSVHSFEYPALSIWQSNHNDNQQELDIDSSKGEDVLVYRNEMVVTMRLLPPGGARFIKCLRNGDALEHSARDAEATGEFDLVNCLSALIESRLVIAAN